MEIRLGHFSIIKKLILISIVVLSAMSVPRFVKEAFVQVPKTVLTPKISKPLIVFLASTQLVFGFNLGFVKQKNDDFKMAAQLLSVTIGITMSGYLAYMVVCSVWGLIFYSIQYFLTFIVLATSSCTFHDFLLDMSMIKTTIREDWIFERIGTVIWVYTSVMFCLKLIAGALYHLIFDVDDWSIRKVIYLVPILGLDNIPIALFLVYYHVYVKLNQLKLGFQNDKMTVLEVQTTYRAVIDILDKIRSTVDHLIVLGFIADCPKWIFAIWNYLNVTKTTESWALACCNCTFALHLTIQMCLPAVCAELVRAQTDALHMLAHERLLDERDENASRSLSRLACYLSARPPLRAAWRLLPPGLRLPTAMLSMCATYLVVVIQLTHIYD